MGELNHTECEIAVPKGKITLQVKGSKELYSFFYATDGKNFKPLGKMNVRYLSSETAGGFTGVYLGLYAVSGSNKSKAYGDFSEFKYIAESD